ncbi:hypothetical protein PHMEG_0004831 [Phytophthora megakarya]|uniref:Uncharacterized protein n=1 Tax=Phytophthora megakarya TaxID=4795 RepID=A0A225WSV3_9STRA|nr:hypothetical protein PHMEG_0004831 [Phytophthora megakarya]
MSGFKRILVRLDEGTRHKYCSRALEEDLQRVQSQMHACVASMAEAKQVEDATRKLHASQRAPVSSDVLVSLETLLHELETATNTLIAGRKPQNGALNTAKVGNEVKEEPKAADIDNSMHQEAKTLVKQILQTTELETAVSEIRKLEKLILSSNEMDDKKKKWWKKHVQKVVEHAVEMATGEDKQDRRLARLEKTLRKIGAKWPELQEWNTNMHKQIAAKRGPPSATKNKKKRAIPVPDDDETPVNVLPVKSKKAKSGASTKEKKGESADKARALLQCCSREVRTLRDKFELGAYDVNLSRMVTVVDSLWPGFEHSEVISLTTSLFTLVETVEKVANQAKRKDRLMCLDSVLGVVLGSSKLQLTARRKTMVEEYANNCRQSLEQLNRQSGSSNTTEQVSSQKKVPVATHHASNATVGKSHVRFS